MPRALGRRPAPRPCLVQDGFLLSGVAARDGRHCWGIVILKVDPGSFHRPAHRPTRATSSERPLRPPCAGDNCHRFGRTCRLFFQDPYRSLNPRQTELGRRSANGRSFSVRGRARKPGAGAEELMGLVASKAEVSEQYPKRILVGAAPSYLNCEGRWPGANAASHCNEASRLSICRCKRNARLVEESPATSIGILFIIA